MLTRRELIVGAGATALVGSLLDFHVEEQLLPVSLAVVGVGSVGRQVLAALRPGGESEVTCLAIDPAQGIGPGVGPDLAAVLSGFDVVIVAAGLGRRTGSAVAPEVARIAREAGARVFGVASWPAFFEGKKTRLRALEAHDALVDAAHGTSLIPCQRGVGPFVHPVSRMAGAVDALRILGDAGRDSLPTLFEALDEQPGELEMAVGDGPTWEAAAESAVERLALDPGAFEGSEWGIVFARSTPPRVGVSTAWRAVEARLPGVRMLQLGGLRRPTRRGEVEVAVVVGGLTYGV